MRFTCARAKNGLSGDVTHSARASSPSESAASSVSRVARGDEFAREPVERLVLRNAPADPAVEGLDAFAVEQPLFGAQQIGPFERPEIGELGTFDQSFDQTPAFLQPPTPGGAG